MKKGPLGLMIFSTLFWMAPLVWSQVPPVAITSTSTIPATGLPGDLGDVALDACGNIYAVNEGSGQVVEVPSGGGAATTVLGANSYGTASLTINQAKNTLYVLQGFTGSVTSIPISNCVPQPGSSSSISIGKLGAISYYWGGSALATDSAGDLFVATGGACCAPNYELLELYANGGSNPSGITLLGNLPNQINSMTVDSSGNIYYADSSGAFYELTVTTAETSTASAVYSAAPVAGPVPSGGSYVSVAGVAIDALGNLYVADAGKSGQYPINGYYPPLNLSSILYVIPYQATGLNPKAGYILAEGSGTSNPLTFATTFAISPTGNIFFGTDNSGANGATIYEMTQSNVNSGSVALGNSGLVTANVVFNAAETPSAFQLTSASGVFSSTGGTCSGGTSYAVNSSCTVTAKFVPTFPGLATGSLALTNASGATLAIGYFEGTGLGAGLTLDPGTISSVGGGFTTPMSVAVDAAGNTYFADAGANAVLEFAPGSTTAVKLGTGLKKPAGVAVDGAGDVIIADTGNNQIVEVPIVSGVPTNADQVTIVSSSTVIAGTKLSGPTGVTVDGQGNLYIADTGNNRIVFLPYYGSWNTANASTLGSGLAAPLATAVDPLGNLYIADSGSGQIYRLPAPVSSTVSLELVAVGFSNPSALATDASGSLFVVDQGNGVIARIPNVSGSLDANAVVEAGIGVSGPYGLALDSTGNLYVSQNTAAAASKVTRTSTTLAFGDWALTTSSGVLAATVEDEGNQSLLLGTPYYTASGNTGDFSISSVASDSCAAGGTVPAGQACEIDASFTPTASGARSDTLSLSSNAANASGQVTLTGNGTTVAATATKLAITSPASGSPAFGQAITLSVTVTATSGTPTGSVTLVIDGVEFGDATLGTSETATFDLASGLTGGSHSLVAIYNGTASFNGSVSSALKLTVTQAVTATALAVVAPYVDPYSADTGNSVSFTATIGFAGVGIPTGTVTFSSGGKTLGTASVEPVSGGLFEAAFSTSSLTVGTYNVVATYSGDPNYVGSASAASTPIYVVSSPIVTTTVSGGTSITSSANSNGTVTFDVTSYGGWTGVIGFSCLASSLPANARCVFSPGYIATAVAPSSSAAIVDTPVTLTVTIDQPPQTPTASGFIWWLAVPTGLLLLFARRRFRNRAFANITLGLALIFAGIAASGIAACTSGVAYTTPTGASTVTVYASSDPWVPNTSSSAVQPCGNGANGQPNTAVAPCSQQAFQVSLTVQ